MTAYIATFVFIIFGFSFMALALHFSGYKKNGGCCTDGIDFTGDKEEDCDTCPNRETESCQLSKLVPQ